MTPVNGAFSYGLVIVTFAVPQGWPLGKGWLVKKFGKVGAERVPKVEQGNSEKRDRMKD